MDHQDPKDPVKTVADFIRENGEGEVAEAIQQYIDYMIDQGLLPEEIRKRG